MAMVLLGGVCALAAAPEVLVATGDRSPLGLPFSRFAGVALDSRNRVVFVGASAAIFRRGPTGLVHLVGAGDLLDGRTLAGVGPPALAVDGCLAFQADFVGGGAAVYRRCGAVTEVVAAVGRPGPRGPALRALGSAVAIGPGGRVAFTALVEGGSTALFVAARPATLTEVTRTGASAPGGGTFLALAVVGVSRAGRVGFRGTATAGRDGLFVWDGIRVLPVAVLGDPGPVVGRLTALGAASMNAADQWAFRATVARTGPTGAVDGVFAADASTAVVRVAAVALAGDPTPLGGTFGDFPTALVPVINGRGTIGFRAGVTGGSAPAAVFVTTADGRLATIVAVGGTIDGARLVRARDPVLADDGSVLVPATLARGAPALLVARAGRLEALVRALDTTDLGPGFRFSDASVTGAAEDAVFLGLQEGLYMAVAPGEVRPIAVLGDPTPIAGLYAGFESPAAGAGGRIVFGATVAGGHAPEALFTVGRRGPELALVPGARVEGGGGVRDLFADALDGPGHPNVGPGGIALPAGLGAGAGLVVQAGGRLTAVARAGERAPGGGRYVRFGTPAVVRGRQVAFVATVGGGGAALVLDAGTRGRVLAAVGRETRTRLGGRFTSFDPPTAGSAGVAFRATLDQADGRADGQGIFLASGRRLIALVGTGDARAGAGAWGRFGTPTFAGRGVVFPAGGPRGTGLYRIPLGHGALPGAVPSRVEQLVGAGEPTPIGGTFVAIGSPSGSRSRAVAFAADLAGARASSAVLLQTTGP